MGRRRGSGGGGAPQVVQQSSSPWGGQAPFLSTLFAQAEALRGGPPRSFFPGQTFAPFQPQEEEALRLGEARARGGSPSTRMSRDYAMGILRGDPDTLRATLGPRVGELLPQVQGQFARGGRFHGGLARQAEQELVTRELGRLRESAADRLERLGPREYEDIARLAAIGESRRDMDQDRIDEAMARHQFAQEEPYQRLRDYQAFIQGHYGGGQGQEQRFPFRGSRLSGALGGALGGASMGGMFGGIPGAAVGGILGGLGGLF